MNKTAYTILLVGAGQLGSRYLQGISDVNLQLLIYVVDPSSESIEIAKKYLSDMPRSDYIDVRYMSSLKELPIEIDLAILATPAHCRLDVLKSIIAGHVVNAWILEKLLAQSTSQLDQIVGLLESHNQVWVNTPRRLMPWHNLVKEKMLNPTVDILKVRLSGANWGLACNAIHFIDLVSWWTNSPVFNICVQNLQYWTFSKRPGFMEVFGRLIVNYRNGSDLELCCDQGDSSLQIETVTSDGIWLINEVEGKAVAPSGHVIDGELSYQSALTSSLVEEILTYGRCGLPSLVDSASQHRPLLDALLKHWNSSHGVEDLIVPIT